jgi:ATP-dependent helicase/nuclease subunit B
MGRVYTIAPEAAFVDELAAGLLDRYGDGGTALSDVLVLLPTRRACRALGEAFLRATGGRPLLLPSMTPIGDIDEDEIGFLAGEDAALAGAADLPPAISGIRRQLLLARLIMGRPAEDGPVGAAHAARLANELARLLDEVQTQRLDFSRLADIVPEDFAAHWQTTLEFLNIVTENWPAILADEGCLDPADRRNRLIEAQIGLWRAEPPAGPVVAAGSTGSLPATADLLTCVADMERGVVILPGLDITLDDDSIAALGPGHPQFGMIRLLDRLGGGVADVSEWRPGAAADFGRSDIVNGALRPPATAAAYAPPTDPAPAFEAVRVVDCPGSQQEALVIALTMREALETPVRTAALVTPDRRLARRVAAELRRWRVDVDDSGGTPLADTVPGVFLRLTAEAVALDAAPVPLLAALKHPLASGGEETSTFRERVRDLERAVLRGPRPAAGVDGLARAARAADGELGAWAEALAASAAPFAELVRRAAVPVPELLDAHIRFAEELAASATETGVARLWADEAGESAAGLVSELRAAAKTLPPIRGAEWPALLDALLEGVVVRPQYGRHPRAHIWGLLEARLQQADLMILGGLNEGVWPPEPATDPWMSRPMRRDFGLPAPERRIGLTAHDFVQGFAARDVVLTRSTRVDGSPTVPARWLTRLETLLGATDGGKDVLRRWQADGARWMRWQNELDLPPDGEDLPLALPPAPSPPLAARPRRLSVTEIETLIRDPYAVYARRVLGLRRLDPIDADPGAADRGIVVHRAIENFFRGLDGPLPPDALDRLLRAGEEAFASLMDRPGVRAFWWPRFQRIARWVVDLEHSREAAVAERHTEIDGALVLPGEPAFELRARADRIDRLAGGDYEIIDYKTGAVPAKKDVNSGLSPQLSLEAAMIQEGAFGALEPAAVSALTYWRLSGGDPPGQARAAGDDPEKLAADALEGLRRLIDFYDAAGTAYRARPDPDIAPRHNDYDHLERIQEWASAGGGE